MPDSIPLKAKAVEEALNKLGATATEIADSLRVKGCKGTVDASGHCPLANYLKDQFPGATIYVYNSTTYLGAERIMHSEPVQRFVSMFDARKYKDLIADD